MNARFKNPIVKSLQLHSRFDRFLVQTKVPMIVSHESLQM